MKVRGHARGVSASRERGDRPAPRPVHGSYQGRATSVPPHFHIMPATGACGKPGGMPHSPRPQARNAGTGGSKMHDGSMTKHAVVVAGGGPTAERGERMRAYVLGFQEVDRTDVGVVGGKGASLGELSRLEGIRVPDGFCVSTEAFKRVLGAAPAIGGLLDRLALLKAEDREAIRELAAAIRGVIEGIAIPEDVQEAITRFLARLGEQEAYAVRSSATAEDLPGASFAGQQDTYLNVIGKPAILKHVSRCWASLFTERAVAYRLQHGFDHRKVHMAVVVQKMLFPQAAGILFTADPVTGNRKVAVDRGWLRPGRGPGLRPGERRWLQGAGRPGHREGRAAGPASADGCADRAARAPGPADRRAFRSAPGHRMVPGRGRIPHRPEPADHDPVPHP